LQTSRSGAGEKDGFNADSLHRHHFFPAGVQQGLNRGQSLHRIGVWFAFDLFGFLI
jgi:hypothetical protein